MITVLHRHNCIWGGMYWGEYVMQEQKMSVRHGGQQLTVLGSGWAICSELRGQGGEGGSGILHACSVTKGIVLVGRQAFCFVRHATG